MWQAFFSLSSGILVTIDTNIYVTIPSLVAALFAPLLGWLADVKFGRYEMIMFSSLSSVIASMVLFLALFAEGALLKALTSVTLTIFCFCTICFTVALVPFLTDQLIGATADELSTVVYWYYWVNNLANALADTITALEIIPADYQLVVPGVVAVPLALIIISDCLCLQWLDRTHKVTNPIKLIIQVLNYTRKHRYPERRSAFTYLDEEQPSRMDFGKEKFGGPFTEEEVEDVKTVLRLIPLMVCLSVSVNNIAPTSLLKYDKDTNILLNIGLSANNTGSYSSAAY